jgi:hypothetical protein
VIISATLRGAGRYTGNHVSFVKARVMTGIGGPGGIGGPKGPDGPDASEAADELDAARDAPAVGASELDALAAELAAGKLTPREAVDRLADEIAGTRHLDAAERAELRELLADLVANDPYLAGLAKHVG